MNRPITSTEIEATIKKFFSNNQKPMARLLQRHILSNVWTRVNTYSAQILPEIAEG